MRQSIRNDLKQVKICAYFENGRRSIVQSPVKAVRVGLRTQFGWRLMLVGAWVIFGKRKSFQTILNPLFDETQNNEQKG